MDLVAPKKDLLRLLARCQGVAEKKTSQPVLANVLLTATPAGNLQLATTDLYLSATGAIPSEVAEPGSVALPAKDLFDRVKAMPDGPLQILVTEDAHATLRSLGSPRRYTLHGVPGRDFPQLPKPAADAPVLTLPASLLSLLLARTHFSVSSDETRPHVNSALFEWSGDRVRLVSTDGHRLSKMEVTVPGTEATATMLIPHKAITELRRLADEATAEDPASTVAIAQSGSTAFFTLGGMQFSVKLVDAQFPPYQQVIPALSDRSLRAPRTLLADALRAISLAAGDRTGGVKISLATNTLRITSESPETGNGFDELSIDYTGPELTIGFNAKYFLDVLGVLTDDEIALGISGELDPAVIRPAAETPDQSYVAVVMPMRI